MKFEKNPVGPKDPVEALYIAEEILPIDIDNPSENGIKFIRDLKGSSLLNVFTLDEFMKQVRQRFTYEKL